jgi:hypothetical protein
MKSSHKGPGALITAIACCLAGLPAPAAFAQELECDKCVNQSDIAQNAVSSGKLRNGSVRERKLGRDVRDRLDTIESRFDVVSVAGAAFTPATPDVMTSKSPAGVVQPLETDDVQVMAGVQLPHGMLLQDMACTVRDASEPGIVSVTLRRFPLDALAPNTTGDRVIRVSSSEVVPFADSTDPHDYRVIYAIAQSLDYSVVDNENYQYSLDARMIDIGDDPSAMALAGCRVRLRKDPF